MAKLPPWLKGASIVNLAKITIDSVNAAGTDPRGAGFNNALPFYAQEDRWVQDTNPLGGYPGTSQIEVQFTLTNKAPRALSGAVGGFLDSTPLSQFQVPSLAQGASISGKVSFKPLKTQGDHT